MVTEKEKKIERLEKLLASTPIKCPHKDCENYLAYAQCNTHAYVLCEVFEDWYSTECMPKTI